MGASPVRPGLGCATLGADAATACVRRGGLACPELIGIMFCYRSFAGSAFVNSHGARKVITPADVAAGLWHSDSWSLDGLYLIPTRQDSSCVVAYWMGATHLLSLRNIADAPLLCVVSVVTYYQASLVEISHSVGVD